MLLTKHSHPIFDVEAEIVRTRNVPPPVDLKPWQDRIDRIAGKTVNGKSRLIIEWGQSATMFSCGKTRSKYPFWRYEEGGEIHDIGIPRFWVSELHTNAELRRGDGWERSRYYRDEVSGELIDVLGPIPEEGFYTAVFMIAHHDEMCCGGKGVVKHEPCLGSYRPPCDSDLQRVRRMKYRRDTASNDDNTPSEALLEKRSDDMSEKREELWRGKTREVIDDYVKTRSHSWTTLDPSVLTHGKFHWVSAHSKSGATIEQIKKWRKEKHASNTAQNGA